MIKHKKDAIKKRDTKPICLEISDEKLEKIKRETEEMRAGFEQLVAEIERITGEKLEKP